MMIMCKNTEMGMSIIGGKSFGHCGWPIIETGGKSGREKRHANFLMKMDDWYVSRSVGFGFMEEPAVDTIQEA